MDSLAFEFFHGIAGRYNILDWIIIFCAEYLGYVLVGIFLVLLFLKQGWIQKRKEILLASALTVIISRGIFTEIIRAFYHSDRPFVREAIKPLFDHPLTASFPSGHAATFFALAFVIYHYDRWWGSVFVLGAILVSLGRVIAGVHYPLDIIGGIGVSLLAVLTTFRLTKRFFLDSKSIDSN